MNRVRITDPELARELEEITSRYQENLIAILETARGTETTDDHHASALGVGEVLASLGSAILFPIYRMHPNLTPDSLKETLEGEKRRARDDQNRM